MSHSVLAIHDLSGIGNTSLMAIIPIMYRYGIRVCALPSALLSANTCFPGYRALDTGDFMRQSICHYQEMGLKFSAIYSGFLGSSEQVQTVIDAIDKLAAEDALIAVDPVMADGGKLYDCYDDSIISAMRRLVKKAQLISPNYTEACLLTGQDPEAPCTADSLDLLCEDLHSLGPRDVTITSVVHKAGSCDILYSSTREELRELIPCDYIPAFYTGTGDIFSAMMVINRLHKIPLKEAIPKVADYIFRAIRKSLDANQEGAWGVVLEEILANELP